jgi:hypothetical protein
MIRSKALIAEMRESPTEPVPGCPFDVIRQYPSGELMGESDWFQLISSHDPTRTRTRPRTRPIHDPRLHPIAADRLGTINLTVSDRTIDLPEPAPGSEEETHLTRYPWARETWDVGYKVLPEFSGRGVASKALGALVEAWAIGVMRLRQVSAVGRESPSSHLREFPSSYRPQGLD